MQIGRRSETGQEAQDGGRGESTGFCPTTNLSDISRAWSSSGAEACFRADVPSQAIDTFFNDPSMQRHAMGSKDEKNKEKKLGDIWERFKGGSGSGSLTLTLRSAPPTHKADLVLMRDADPSDPKLIKIDGTMQLCEELGIDPESVRSAIARDVERS